MFQLLLYISANVRETGRANVFDAYSDRLGSEEALVKRIFDLATLVVSGVDVSPDHWNRLGLHNLRKFLKIRFGPVTWYLV